MIKSNWIKIALIAGSVLALIVIGFFAITKWLPSMYACDPCPSDAVLKQSLLDEFDNKFQQKYNDGALPPMTMGTMSSINLWGKIVKVDSNSLTLRIANRYQEGNFADYVLNQPSFYDIKIVTDAATKITKLVPLTPQEMTAGKTPKEKTIALSDLKEGTTVDVELSQPIDFSVVKEVNAIGIRLSLPTP